MLAIRLHRVGFGGIDDDWAVMANRLLHARMAMIPVGA